MSSNKGRSTTLDGNFYDDDFPSSTVGSASDFNADFPSQFNTNNHRRGNSALKDEHKQPIIHGMDYGVEDYTNTSGGNRRPNAVTSRSKTIGSNPSTQSSATKQRKSTTFFGIKTGLSNSQKEDKNILISHSVQSKDDGGYNNGNEGKLLLERTAPICIGRRKIAVWPYDDYHLVQKMYYEKLQESALEQQQQSQQNYRTKQNPRQKPSLKAKEDAERQLAEAQALQQHQQDQSVPIFSRPSDPPDIPTAVQGLSLTVFEEKAEERAIIIVSTWLFDAELIDELLVNGGMTAKMMVNREESKNRDGNNNYDGVSVGEESERSGKTTSEGVEVGSHGFPIEGSTKMDKEIAKLRNSTKRQLALINARLNDGVVATGGEVQELVKRKMTSVDYVNFQHMSQITMMLKKHLDSCSLNILN